MSDIIKSLLTLLFLSIGVNLFSYPVRLCRLYNPVTDVGVDIISDPDLSCNRMGGLEGFKSVFCLFADLRNEGEVKFIWECSRQEAAAIQKAFAGQKLGGKVKEVFSILQEDFTANVRPLVENMQKMLPNEEMQRLCSAIVDNPSLAFNGLAKTIYPDEDLSWYSCFLYISGEQKDIYHHLSLTCDTQIDNLLQKQESAIYSYVDLRSIFESLDNNFVCSDIVCQGAINLKECLAQLSRLLHVGRYRGRIDYVGGYTYRQWVMAVKIVLIQLFVVNFAIFASNALNILVQMAGKIYKPVFSEQVDNLRRSSIELDKKIRSEISRFWSAGCIEHSLPIAHSIFNSFNQLANSILELEFTGNILACDKQRDKKRIVVYVNNDTARGLCFTLRCYRFVNLGNVCFDPDFSTSWQGYKMMSHVELNNFFLEDPQNTYTKYQKDTHCNVL